MRRAVIVLIALAMVAMATPFALHHFAARRQPPRGPSPQPDPASAAPPSPPAPVVRAGPVNVAVDGFFAWAMYDRETRGYAGSANMDQTSSTESMIKIWIVSDFLRRTAEARRQPTSTQLGWASRAIRDGLPPSIVAEGVGIKNGWTLISADGLWHVNCLAVHPKWVLAVMLRYPGRYGLRYGADACRSVAQQLVITAGR